ncbi:MAG: hypothetical protein KAV44_00720 [Bacteroidales bacterium]|nr:hypothetical protein [Bacteroidales bacterium]
MLLTNIQADASLSYFISNSCTENNVSIIIAHEISNEDYCIIKVDDYYNSLHLAITPPSPDCLIIQRCSFGYIITIVELKDISSPRSFNKEQIRQKFETCLLDFMSNKFRRYFYDLNIIIKDIHLFFVSDPYQQITKPNKIKDKSLLIDIFLSLRPLTFVNKKYYINPILPNPTIYEC